MESETEKVLSLIHFFFLNLISTIFLSNRFYPTRFTRWLWGWRRQVSRFCPKLYGRWKHSSDARGQGDLWYLLFTQTRQTLPLIKRDRF